MGRHDENISIPHGWFEIVPAQADLTQLETTVAEFTKNRHPFGNQHRLSRNSDGLSQDQVLDGDSFFLSHEELSGGTPEQLSFV